VVTCRHEAAAANMAEAYGKLTGRPGVCMVTRGPGASHAAIGVHTAEQDSTPMILFVGQVARADRGRGAFQEVDYRQMFGKVAKWATELEEGERVEEVVRRGFAVALNGRRGPVVISLPEDLLVESVADEPLSPLVEPAPIGLAPQVAATIAERLHRAERPLLLLGGSGWDAASAALIAGWAQSASLPIVLSFRRKALIDNDHPCYVGDLGLGANPALAARVQSCDLLVALGARLGENPTAGYSLFKPGETARKLVHIYPDPNELDRVWPCAIAAVADMKSAAEGLARLELTRNWSGWCADAREDYERFSQPVQVTGAVNPSELFAALRRALPDDAIVANGAGNYAGWLHRFFPHKSFGTQLAPTSGAMGYGFPAGLAAKLVHPEREVVVVAGDGCFMMAAQELATALKYDLAVIIIVIDNGAYGTIRMHQERDFPGRVIGTELTNPDFVAYAEAFGAFGCRVDRTEGFPSALAAARAARRPAIILVRTLVDDISPGRTLSRSPAAPTSQSAGGAPALTPGP
jgi:acetolactate synthase-1/2/3 large subunit